MDRFGRAAIEASLVAIGWSYSGIYEYDDLQIYGNHRLHVLLL